MSSSATSPTTFPADAPKPRLCRITKWPDFDGYGFHLQAIKSKPGQFIGKIDANSPAEAAGMRQGDRIVEVNGVNVNNENHVQVVERIKANPKTVDLLVVDPTCYSYYSERGAIVSSAWENVELIANKPRDGDADANEEDTTPVSRPPPAIEVRTSPPHVNGNNRDRANGTPSPNPSSESGRSSSVKSNRSSEPATSDNEMKKDDVKPRKSEENNRVVSAKSSSDTSNGSGGKMISDEKAVPTATTPTPTPTPTSTSSSSTDKLIFEFDRLSAAEMRARLAERKRIDPRQDNLTAKQKHQIIQAL